MQNSAIRCLFHPLLRRPLFSIDAFCTTQLTFPFAPPRCLLLKHSSTVLLTASRSTWRICPSSHVLYSCRPWRTHSMTVCFHSPRYPEQRTFQKASRCCPIQRPFPSMVWCLVPAHLMFCLMSLRRLCTAAPHQPPVLTGSFISRALLLASAPCTLCSLPHPGHAWM